MNSERLRQRLSTVYASATRAGSRVFHASSAMRAFCVAASSVKGGSGGLSMDTEPIAVVAKVFPHARGCQTELLERVMMSAVLSLRIGRHQPRHGRLHERREGLVEMRI